MSGFTSAWLRASEVYARYAERLAYPVIAAVVLVWATGVHASVVAPILLAASVLGCCLRSRTRFPNQPRWFSCFLVAIPFVYIALLFGQQWASFLLGKQGVDFAIFAQVIQTAATRGVLATTLLAADEVNFLTHHFSPILYLPSLLVKLIPDASFVAIFVHLLAVISAFGILFLYSRELRFSKEHSMLLLVLLAMHPSLRVGLFWEVHDEIFSLPFVAAAYLFSARRKRALVFIAVIGATLCKENLFLFALLFSIRELLLPSRQVGEGRLVVALLSLSLVGLAAYSWAGPQFFFTQTFNPLSRLASVETLISGPEFSARARYLFWLLAPLAALPLLSVSGRLAAIPALAFIGPNLISNSKSMYDPIAYYAVVPVFILGLASLHTLEEWKNEKREASVFIAWIALGFAFQVGGYMRPAKTIRSAFSVPLPRIEELSCLPPQTRLLVQDHESSLFLNSFVPLRWGLAEHKSIPFDFVAMNNSRQENLPKYAEDARLCMRTTSWSLFCRKELPKHCKS